jgi:hypothetical protein
VEPASTDLQGLMVDSLCKLGENATALQVALQIANEKPGSTVAAFAMKKALLASGEFRKSVLYLEQLQAADHTPEDVVFSLVHVSMYCGEFTKVAQYVDQFSKKHPDSKLRARLSFDAAVSECYTAECSLDRQQSLKDALKGGVEDGTCCTQHVILAIGAIHNMGDTTLARELVKKLNETGYDEPALLQYRRLKKALNEGTRMEPVIFD